MAGVTEKYVNTVRELTATPGNVNALCTFISKSIESLVKCPIIHLDTALETLLPDQHALGILAIILVKYQQLEHIDVASGKKYYGVDASELKKLMTQTDTFIATCNFDRVAHATDSYCEMINRLVEILIERKEAGRGIPITIRAIEKLRQHESQLTLLHSNLCHLCLSAKRFEPVLPFLDVDITDLHRVIGSASFDSKSFLLYYYYGGMIYAAMKRFKRAAFFFEIVISTPASVVSVIMIEAYKKFILVSLIYNRAEPVVPKFTAPVLARYAKSGAAAYNDLATSYGTSVQSNLQATVDKHRTVYEQDLNYGLVKQCIKSLCKKNIHKLTKIFLTLSLADVADRVHLANSAEAEKYILHMIEDGEIYATINKKDGMVEFHDNPERYNNPEMLKFLQKQEEVCMQMNSKISEFDGAISLTADYINKMAAYSGDDDSKAGSSGATASDNLFK